MVAKLPKAARPQKSLHDEMIGALIRPSWLMNASLLDNVWIIKSKKNDAEETIYFNAPITTWPNAECLTDDRFQQDLITVKLILYFSMKPKPIGWATKGSTVVDIFQAHVDFVRWRTDRGVASNSELSAPWYNDFDRCFKLRAREGLLRLAERALPVLEAVKKRTLIPERDDRGGIAGDPFARLIGMSKSSGVTVHARIMIERFFSKNGIRYTRTAESRKEPLQVNESVTNGNAYKYYRVWLDLWRLRDQLPHDIIGYKAFSSGRKLAKHVNRFFETATATDDAPAYQTSYLINSALKLLLDPVCDKILDLVENGGINENREVIDRKALFECNERLKHLGLPMMGTLYHTDRWRQSAKLTLHNMIFKVLPVAARIVTTAFSARRDAEIESSPIDCIHIDQRGETWLNCMIVKNVDQKDLVPIPKSVARAVEVVRRIRALGNKTSEKLYDFACPFLKRAVKFDVREFLDMVRDYFGVPLLDDGTAWAFRPHQFRKFFAVTYFWRWAFPDLTALTFHLRHFNPDTTRGYIEMKAAEALRMRDEKLAAEHRNWDVERKKTFDDTKSAFVLSVVRGVANGEPLGGSMGRQIEARINALKDEFLSEIHVTEMQDDRPSFDQMLADLASTVSLEPHPEGFNLCGFGTGPETIRQHCSMSVCLLLREKLTGQPSASASKQDYGYAEPLGCLKCGCRASLEIMSAKWEAEVQDAEQALLDANDEFAPFIKERIRMIEEYA
ncbi:hypothetical protein [Rhizobium laguerreae]|uniref:hypothetical protein n=1 Tax=Rhizobium laguerreae TaxID=1076926 RepID=UPI00103DCAA4|nr:hypothetical protein [Rhizobium laguerreae]TBY02096.1 hypothetical protein E0I94_30645 [Rhizobium laguerreae]